MEPPRWVTLGQRGLVMKGAAKASLLTIAMAAGISATQAKDVQQCGDPGTPAGLRQIAAGAPPCAKASKPKLTAPSRPRQSTAQEIARAKAYFNRSLRDPETARWREFQTWPGGWVCGFINAKNGFGGYAGWHRFWYRAGEGDISRDGVNTFGETVPCLDAAPPNYQAQAMREMGI